MPIEFRLLTGSNEYPVLSFLEDKFPEELTSILGLESEPIIQKENPIIESINKFRDASGNQDLVETYVDAKGYKYALNQNEQTIEIDQNKLGGKERFGKSKYSQSSEDFDFQTARYDGEGVEFVYAPILTPFQNSDSNELWTSILMMEAGNIDKGYALQFPQLRAAKILGLARSSWIQKIIENNPEQRGLVAYLYQFASLARVAKMERPKIFFYGGHDGNSISRLAASPYLRFLDIKNSGNVSAKMKSMNVKILEKDFYELTEVDNRSSLFNKIQPQEIQLGITIPPNQHVLIPFEFGFDNRSIEKKVGYENATKTMLQELHDKKIRISKIVTKNLDRTNYDISDVSEETRLSRIFIDKTSTLENLFHKIPRRLAVGSIMNVLSVTVNDLKIEIDPPLKAPSFTLSADFYYGSCPYLLVRRQDNPNWVDLGNVFYERGHEALKGTEVHNLGIHPLKIRIEEREDEISYIDALSIIYIDAKTNTTQEVFPKIPKINKLDQDYLILHKGEYLEIDLQKLLPVQANNIRLRVSGYYKLV